MAMSNEEVYILGSGKVIVCEENVLEPIVLRFACIAGCLRI
jgi:hypothetical protein